MKREVIWGRAKQRHFKIHQEITKSFQTQTNAPYLCSCVFRICISVCIGIWLIWGAKYCKWSAFLSFFTQPADIVVLNEMKVPSWYFGFLQETIRDVISIAWWLWTAESLVIISDDLDALEIWSSTSTPMRPQQRFHDHKYKITKSTQKQIH